MNTVKSKRLLVVAAALTVLIAVTLLFGTLFDAANAEEAIMPLDNVTYTMTPGASVQLAGNHGIRFAGQLSDTDYTALKTAYGEENIAFGVFIMPTWYLPEAELTEDDFFGANAKYVWGATEKTGTQKKILHANCSTNQVGTDWLMSGAVVGMLDENLATKYVGISYIKVTSGESTLYKLATGSDNATRSMIEVSIRARESGDYDSDQAALDAIDGYISTYKTWYAAENPTAPDPKYSYTVKTLSENADGTYTESSATVDKQGGADIGIDTEVTYVPTPPDGYTVNADKSVLSGRVYADNATLLTIQYDLIDYTIEYAGLQSGDVNPNTITSYNVLTDTITFAAPTGRTGYTGSFSPASIAKGSTGNKTVQAEWVINQYTVSFNTDGGNVIPAQKVDYGTPATVLAGFIPEKVGCRFGGWTFEDGSAIPSDATVTQSITVKAVWIGTVEIDTLSELTANAGNNVDFKLMTDLAITFDGSLNVASTIATLNTVFDGNGHTVMITVTHTQANTDCLQNFIGTIGASGILKNTNFVCGLTLTGNVNGGSLLVGTNNGIMKDCAVSIAFTNHWVNNIFGMLSFNGTGEFSNIVIQCESAAQVGEAVGFINANGEAAKVNNVIIFNSVGALTSSKVTNSLVVTNTEHYADEAAFGAASPAYDTSSFSAPVWELNDNGVPTIKKPTVEINSLDDLTANASKAVNFKLMTDLAITFDGSANVASTIATLNTVFDGNGHTVTITVTHTQANTDCLQNFIGTIGANGVLKNTNFVCGLTLTGNVNGGSLLVGTNNGIMKDCAVSIAFTNHWVNNIFGMLSFNGTGEFSNIVIQCAATYQVGEAVGFINANGEAAKVNNVIIFNSVGALTSGKVQNNLIVNNVKHFADQTAFGAASPAYDTSSFSASVWELDANGVPVFKTKTI